MICDNENENRSKNGLVKNEINMNVHGTPKISYHIYLRILNRICVEK